MALLELPSNYEIRLYAGWLGKCVGVRLGLPFEDRGTQYRMAHLKKGLDYSPLFAQTHFGPDDATSLALILAQAIADYGPDVTTFQIGETWLNYLADCRGTLRWDGYGVSSEHTAYRNLSANIPAPQSGSAELNGLTTAEQVGGQRYHDFWGLLVPNHPRLAASYAECAASVSCDGAGIHGARFVAALVSAAFNELEPRDLIEAGLSVIPAESAYAQTVRAVTDCHAAHPDDMAPAFALLSETFGVKRDNARMPILPNAAALAAALLYGSGDFTRTMELAVEIGWNTGSNMGNLGMILGVANGLSHIPERWRIPLNDTLIVANLIGARNLLDLGDCADLLCQLGRQIVGIAESKSISRPRYHFTYPGGTQGFRVRSRRGQVTGIAQVPGEMGGALQAAVTHLHNRGQVRLFVDTACPLDALSDRRYAMPVTPKVAPGQVIRARCFLPPDAPAPVKVALYVHDAGQNKDLQGKRVLLEPGASQELAFQIPEVEGGGLSEVGLVMRNPNPGYWDGALFLETLDWDGHPCFTYELSERGLEQWTTLRGYWRVEDGGYHGSGVGINEIYSGDVGWRNLTLTVRMMPLVGDYHNCNLRVQGALRSYAVGLAPGQQVVLYKNMHGYHVLTRKKFPWEHGKAYEISVTAEDNHLVVLVDGELMLVWSDQDDPYLNGQIGLSNFSGCHTRYEQVRIS